MLNGREVEGGLIGGERIVWHVKPGAVSPGPLHSPGGHGVIYYKGILIIYYEGLGATLKEVFGLRKVRESTRAMV